jgi:hypothetical protein
MEADDWFILILIDALVSVPLHFTVMIFLASRSEKQYFNELEIYFAIFFVVFVISIIVLKKKIKREATLNS